MGMRRRRCLEEQPGKRSIVPVKTGASIRAMARFSVSCHWSVDSGVTTQKERGRAYRYYMQRAAAHPMCLGAHYFTLNDQAYLGRFDGENYQIGIVDVTLRPYEDFEEGIIETHRELYDIAEGKKPADAEPAEEIPAIFF